MNIGQIYILKLGDFMAHKNGKDIFPDELLQEIQNYIDGENVYIPKKDLKRTWGEKTGIKDELIQRNSQMRKLFQTGTTIDELAFLYGLSEYTVKKIVYQKRK